MFEHFKDTLQMYFYVNGKWKYSEVHRTNNKSYDKQQYLQCVCVCVGPIRKGVESETKREVKESLQELK